MNAFQSLLKQYHNKYAAAAHLLRFAAEAGAFQSQQSANDAAFWSDSLDESVDITTELPGTRGGLVWRYLVALSGWLGLLDRVHKLLGTDACVAVRALATQPGDLKTPDGDKAVNVIRQALTSPGFKQYVQARLGEDNALREQEQQVEEYLRPSTKMPAAEAVDFLAHLIVQDLELVDLARVSAVWESLARLWPSAMFGENLYGVGDDTVTLLRALADIAQSIATSRLGTRRLIEQAVESDNALKSLVLSRLSPFAESQFVIAAPNGRSNRENTGLLFDFIQQDCSSRIRNNGIDALSRLQLPNTSSLVLKKTLEVLSCVSVPFLYWCSISGIPLTRLWDRPDGDISIWPQEKHPAESILNLAVASKVRRKSFRGAIRYLSSAIRRRRHTLCLLVTDHWNEDEATAAYQALSSDCESEAIVVLRSDGPRYPVSVFAFPGR
jgi:hypothetical protein